MVVSLADAEEPAELTSLEILVPSVNVVSIEVLFSVLESLSEVSLVGLCVVYTAEEPCEYVPLNSETIAAGEVT